MSAPMLTRNERAAWERLTNQPGPRTRTMKEVVAKIQHYVETYDKQRGYEDYRDDTLLNDMLYMIGEAMDEKYKWANGFTDFKVFLIEFLTNQLALENKEFPKAKND